MLIKLLLTLMSMDGWITTREEVSLVKGKAVIRTVTAPNIWRCMHPDCGKEIPPGTKCLKKGKIVACMEHAHWLGLVVESEEGR